MSLPLPAAAGAQPVRRSLLKRLTGLVGGSFLLGPLQALLGRATPAMANIQTNQGFLGEIIMGGFYFTPSGYLPCDGRLLLIQQNTALFSLLGTTYGGNGRTNFALPDLRDRVALGAGQGRGLSSYNLGDSGGEQTHTLDFSEMPLHTHTLDLTYSTALGTTDNPAGAFLASNASGLAQYEATGTPSTATGATGTTSVAPHNNMQPYLGINYFICTSGIFPSRP
jgi:microcystin-dependent protein